MCLRNVALQESVLQPRNIHQTLSQSEKEVDWIWFGVCEVEMHSKSNKGSKYLKCSKS